MVKGPNTKFEMSDSGRWKMKKLLAFLVFLSVCLSFGCTKIAIVRDVSGVRKIFSIRTNGGAEQNISPAGSTVYKFPDVSPDGTKIAYTDSENIYISNVDDIGGSSQHQLSTPTGRKAWLRWSPNQMVIAYACYSVANRASIYLSATNVNNHLPATYPTGSQSDGGGHDFFLKSESLEAAYLIYSRDGELYEMFFNGTQPATQITSSSAVRKTLPVVSHNRKLLAYRTSVQLAATGTTDIIVVSNVGTWTTVNSFVLQSPAKIGTISAIAFSKDDTRLYIAAEKTVGTGNKREIFSVNLDGSDQKQLTDNDVLDTQPDAFLN